MTLVILAAGMGSRYGGLKQMDPMTKDGNFIIDFSIYDAIRAGFDEIVFIIKKENYEAFHETIGARIEKKVKVVYVFQDLADIPEGFSVPEGRVKPWGTTHALRAAREVIHGPYGVINADDFYGRDTFEKLAAHLRRMESHEWDNEGVDHCCAIGFKVKNTLTDKGTSSRGVCQVDGNDMLTSIVERLKVQKVGDNAAYLDEKDQWIDLPGETTVSMNCWGLSARTIDFFTEEFKTFMAELPEAPNPLKAECLLPNSVDKMMKAGLVDVKVYRTESSWFGVTYPEDKPWVVASIRELTEKGEYPEHLWAD
jgi:hypothetical protein